MATIGRKVRYSGSVFLVKGLRGFGQAIFTEVLLAVII
ncbi:hypothetical protein SAMN04490355_103121 [Pelosinus propionicus DSM 13327]|uniref:Uncharacterized protein n=1 Tax=Pelosinus propionicus DSM 13327 TaxID=1123291 RepID=A0A1I4M9Q0_9FIRM|nr:hypothetical protein SAMN04490355_103121 [Pelosinus propionicus DSM 13327]